IEADYAALECARMNVTDERAHFHWADATRLTPAQPFDGIITNPPFHTSRKADPDIGRSFITAAAGMLTPSGQMWLVANRHLPYERTLAGVFRNVEEIAGDNAFKILRATRPLRGPRAAR
ncbi:MAG: methyltransferase, partial [Marinosulfonomonas sp.]|nr:methyltransferase [Marinosulfonomonas sp.]